jgi:AmmeMemoRadiSam system protein A
MSQLSEASTSAAASDGAEYTSEERGLLLQFAHAAIISVAENREPPAANPQPHLCEPRGVFTTLYLHGALRGCVGFPSPVLPLYRAVMDSARAAASEDPRFQPVRPTEAHELRISISVLSPLRRILPEEVEIGRHGLVITDGGRRGLLLPQVPVEHGWDRVTFLEQVCRKAGLPPHAWRGAQLEAFTAEVIEDPA